MSLIRSGPGEKPLQDIAEQLDGLFLRSADMTPENQKAMVMASGGFLLRLLHEQQRTFADVLNLPKPQVQPTT